jgi:hypothetical protein
VLSSICLDRSGGSDLTEERVFMRREKSLVTIIVWATAFAAVLWPARDAGAQTPGGAATQAGTRLITLGTRVGPVPVAHQAQASNLLIVNGALYLIDAGDGTLRRLAKAGIKFNEIGVIFIPTRIATTLLD